MADSFSHALVVIDTAAEIGELVWRFEQNELDTARVRTNSAQRLRRMTPPVVCTYSRDEVLDPDLFEQLCAAAF